MHYTKKIEDKIRDEARRIQSEFGMTALANPQIYDEAAARAVESLTPLEIGHVLYPGCRGVALEEVPSAVIEEHRRRHTDEDLRQGQFIVVNGSHEHYVFIMGHETKRRKDGERSL